MLYIFRGLPGSGKSTAANALGCIVVEPQDHWSHRHGKYRWIADEADEASSRSLWLVEKLMQLEYDIAIAEVLTKLDHVEPYLELARDHGYMYEVKDIYITIGDAASRNTHGVPEEHIKKMLEEWEPFTSSS